MDNISIITTERIYLRPFVRDDVGLLRSVFDDDFARTFYPQMTDAATANAWIDRNLERYRNDGFGLWAMCLRNNDEMIGDCGLTWQTIEDSREIEIGYHLRADQRGRGLAIEAATACKIHGFIALGVRRLVSMVHPDNHSSRRLAQQLHSRSRRFDRLGARHYLFYTEREDWTNAPSKIPIVSKT